MGVFAPQLWEVVQIEHDAGDGMRIGLDDYPIHDPANRAVLNDLIMTEYWEREIGLETIPLFVRRLRLKMFQIMPYYNKIFATEDIEYGPLDTFDLNTVRDDSSTETAENTANGDSTVTSSSGARNVNSDTPQTMLSGDEDYATSAADANSSATADTLSNQSTSAKNEAAGTGTTKITGFQGNASDQLQKFRAAQLNINMMIVPELNELFMLVRGNGAEILPSYDMTYPLPSLGGF